VFKALIATLGKDQVVKRLGQLSAGDRERLTGVLRNILGVEG